MCYPRLANFIGGKSIEPVDGGYEELADPCTGSGYTLSPVSGCKDVDLAMHAAAVAFEEWRWTTPRRRQQALLRIADALESRMTDFAAAEARSTGSAAAAAETPLMVDQLCFFAGAARLLEGRPAGEYAENQTSYIRREPVGVCAQLAPWNFPLLMAVLKSAPAIAAGNTVVLKPAVTTPQTALLLADLASEFLPPGVLNVVCGDGATGRLMVQHPVPAMISVTGSIAVGMDIAKMAAADLKRVHLELGGKTPVIVCADADLSAAVSRIITAAYGNAGQDCTAASRVLAEQEIFDDLSAALATAARAVRPGPPDDSSALYGPLNNRQQLKRVAGFVERLPRHARVLAGGHRVGEAGYFFAPTVIEGVRQQDEITQNEVFGPVITVQPFETEDEAVCLANGVPQGLASSVWTLNHPKAMRFTQRLDFGCVWVNTHLGFPSEMPHGGFKHSGYGKDLSVYGLEDYTRIKHVMHNLDG